MTAMRGTDNRSSNGPGVPVQVVHPPEDAVSRAVAAALAEDLTGIGDLTASLISPEAHSRALVVSRQAGVLAGCMCAREAFHQVDPDLQVLSHLDDGASLVPGSVIAAVRGRLRSILTAERTALNFLCHLSGVASLTRRYADIVATANPRARVRDTRKTVPGLRVLEKAAVRAGGGINHRLSLSDGVLIKDNHLGAISISEAVHEALERWADLSIEVECESLDQVVEAVTAGAPAVLLDNMGPDEVRVCAELVRRGGRSVVIEVSGGVTLETAPALAAAGADFISVGALTHSAPALDIGLDLDPEV